MRSLLFALAACRIEPIDLTGKACPCPAEWLCDPSTNTCVRSTTPDGNPDQDSITYDLTSRLEYHFRLDETSGQTVNDSSTTLRHGHVFSTTNAMWTEGKVGNGLYVNGTQYSAYVAFPWPAGADSCDNIPAITGDLTVSAWVRFDSFTDAIYTLSNVAVMHGSAGGVDGGWGLGSINLCGATTAGMTITAPGGTMRVNRCGVTTLETATWYHLAGVYDANDRTLDVYLNGVKDSGALSAGSSAIPNGLNAPPSAVCLYLAAASNQQQLLVGTLDEVRVYSRALTPAEIAELYRVSQ